VYYAPSPLFVERGVPMLAGRGEVKYSNYHVGLDFYCLGLHVVFLTLHFMNFLNPFWARKRIAQLDPEKDAHEVSHLAFEVRYGTPLFTHSIFSVAFARQAAIPSIAKVLYRGGRGGIITNTRKRNNDTLLFFGEFYKHGTTGEGRLAIELLNKIHSHFPITNEENLYTLATIVCEPRRMGMFLANRDLFTKKEFRAVYNFWKQLCTLMNIHSIPATEEAMYTWYEKFEQEHYG
jgi:hypothetical protein